MRGSSALTHLSAAGTAADQRPRMRVIDPFSVNQCRSRAQRAAALSILPRVSEEPFNLIGH